MVSWGTWLCICCVIIKTFHTGTITIEEVRIALKTLGQDVSDEEVAELMGDVSYGRIICFIPGNIDISIRYLHY